MDPEVASALLDEWLRSDPGALTDLFPEGIEPEGIFSDVHEGVNGSWLAVRQWRGATDDGQAKSISVSFSSGLNSVDEVRGTISAWDEQPPAEEVRPGILFAGRFTNPMNGVAQTSAVVALPDNVVVGVLGANVGDADLTGILGQAVEAANAVAPDGVGSIND